MLRQQNIPVGAGGRARQCIAARRLPSPFFSRHVVIHYAGSARDGLNGLNRNSVPVLPKINSVGDLINALDSNPALRTVFDILADIFELEAVRLHYKPSEGPEVCVEVLRGDLLSACSSLKSMRQFLKEQLSIGHAQDIAVSWRDDAVPNGQQHLISGPEYLEAWPLPFIVGKASDWYVGEASTATAEKQAS